jgi:hypothetical protein
MLVTLDFALELRGSEIFIAQVDKEILSSKGAIVSASHKWAVIDWRNGCAYEYFVPTAG